MQKERREMSTADLARQADAADNAVLERDVIVDRRPNTDDTPRTMLFEEQDAQQFRARWADIQAGFVDAPRAAVEHADALVAETLKRMAEMFSRERGNLEAQWDRGNDATTEDLRIALQRYRAFFDRLLNV